MKKKINKDKTEIWTLKIKSPWKEKENKNKQGKSGSKGQITL
jgi:hypothetical protein